MTQKHFIAAAAQLCRNRQMWVTQYGQQAYNALVSEFIELCHSQGNRFDVDKFRQYLATH